ncbi:hypothetical protein ZEAMMB73_Zm00001d032847 [Zea mays]|uniref:Uncharacterized protein n=1 Tax=Zea mays TaxID=4577 RepID=A0A1D6KUD5_MAIZE|nr:hypothetical protein ZEAMMB73_Zm00001d032843 [Zea mays]ONM06194.1 hypothetical protein ZEAMMB73_Zm00001d032847 [Zea mays]
MTSSASGAGQIRPASPPPPTALQPSPRCLGPSRRGYLQPPVNLPTWPPPAAQIRCTTSRRQPPTAQTPCSTRESRQPLPLAAGRVDPLLHQGVGRPDPLLHQGEPPAAPPLCPNPRPRDCAPP